ncbi:MAG TPA: AMIN domain-containing protein, partial [Chromatiales bacterium]|nr:AMIN domain-containing protein [Chromatiales bacterium]
MSHRVARGRVWEYLTMSTARPIPAYVAKRATSRVLGGLLTSLILVLAGMANAFAQEPANSLKDVQVQALPGNRIELRLKLAQPASEPLSFTIDSPARIALDLRDTSLALPARRKDIGVGVLDTVLAAEASGRTRVVLNLDQMVPYQTRVDGNDVVVLLEAPGSQGNVVAFESAPQKPQADSGSRPVAPAGQRAIENVDFRRSETGAGRVIVTLTEPGTPVDVSKEGGRIILNFAGTNVTDEQTKRLDVLDFATPVNTIDVMRVGGDARIVVAATGDYEELAYQSDGVFTLEVQRKPEEKVADKPTLFSPDRKYTGERLTLNFQDIETRAVLQLLADVSGRNVVVSDTVQGNVTLRLQNVPWDQALDIVLAAR